MADFGLKTFETEITEIGPTERLNWPAVVFSPVNNDLKGFGYVFDIRVTWLSDSVTFTTREVAAKDELSARQTLAAWAKRQGIRKVEIFRCRPPMCSETRQAIERINQELQRDLRSRHGQG